MPTNVETTLPLAAPAAQFLNEKQVAAILAVSVQTVRRLTARKELRSVKVSRLRRYPREAVQQFIAQLSA